MAFSFSITIIGKNRKNKTKQNPSSLNQPYFSRDRGLAYNRIVPAHSFWSNLMQRILAFVVLCLLATSSRADLLPPGQKPVEHLIRIENIKAYPDHVFFIYPRDLDRGLPGNTSVRVGDNGEGSLSGNPIARREGAFLYAIPRSLFTDKISVPREEWFQKPQAGILKSALVGQIRTVPVSDPRKRIVTRYEIEIKDNLKLTILKDEKKEEKTSSLGERWTIALGFAMFAAFSTAGLVWTRVRRRPA
jgi:hypothetical protein